MERIYKCPKDNTDHIISQKTPTLQRQIKIKKKSPKKRTRDKTENFPFPRLRFVSCSFLRVSLFVCRALLLCTVFGFCLDFLFFSRE